MHRSLMNHERLGLFINRYVVHVYAFNCVHYVDARSRHVNQFSQADNGFIKTITFIPAH